MSDHRGGIMLEFITSWDLCLENSAESSPTFETPYGRSWIDLTLSGGGIVRQLRNWRVESWLIHSDHNSLLFEVSTDSSNRQRQINRVCF